MPSANLMVVQGGGPTAVLNASLAAIVSEAQVHPEIRRILGSRDGILGLLREDISDLTPLSEAELQQLRRTPGAALGSSRHKPTEDELDVLAATLRKFDIGYLLFLGGNGTMHGAQLISSFLQSIGSDIAVVGIPKTVDNDLAQTDRCPGFASAARYLAASTRELGADLRCLPQPVTILETMGRSVGWLAASTVLAQAEGNGAPHLVCIPEIPFDTGSFLAELDRIVQSNGYAVIVVAEGIAYANGEPVYQSLDQSQTDALNRPMVGGVAQHLAGIVSQQLGIRCRNEKPGLLGRSSIALASEQDRADAALVGRAGVQALVSGSRDTMVSLQPLSAGLMPGFRLVPLAECAGHERPIPAKWLQAGPIPVSQAFREYLEPLVGTLEEHLIDLPQATVPEGDNIQ